MPSIGRKQTLDDENALWDAEAHLIAAFLWKRATKTGAIASILSGTIVTLLWTFVLDTAGWHPFLQEVTYPAAGLSVLALVVGSLLTPAPDRRIWGQFFGDGGKSEAAA